MCVKRSSSLISHALSSYSVLVAFVSICDWLPVWCTARPHYVGLDRLNISIVLSNLRFVYIFTDRSLIMWKLTRDETNYGIPQRSLTGHSHFVSDVVISSDGQFALSGAWDSTLRLWDLST